MSSTGASLPPLREVIARYGLGARKSLGQHFLLDLNLTGRIARAAGDLSQGTVIEVGPGPGGLTRALLDTGARKLVVIERDERCLDALAEISAAYPGRLEIIAGDALDVALHEIGQPPRRICANLPYNIATPLLLGWLEHATAFASLTLMFQKEVADRLLARPRTAAYGRLSIAAQWRAEVRRLFDIDRRAFTPPPKVASTVIELIPRAAPLAAANGRLLEQVTAAAVGPRRELLRQSLRSLGVDVMALLTEVGVVPTRRAEELSIEEFCALARALSGLRAAG